MDGKVYVCKMAPSPPVGLRHEVFKIWCPWCGKKLAEHETIDLGGERDDREAARA